jgi:hypothetical protein
LGTDTRDTVVPTVRGFKLVARVSSADLEAIRPALERALPDGSVKEADGELLVEAEMSGQSAKDLNRALLSSLRRTERRTRLRAEWTSEDGTRERYFDYVLKNTSRA